MDFYLIANCKFLVGSASGLTSITAFWGRPVLITNLNAFCYGFESLPTTKFDLYIPKKFYSIKDKRYLNLYEMFVISNRCDRYNERFEKEGIQVIVIENLRFLSLENLEWISEYTYVFANTFVMARCAIKLAQRRRVYLWLHESVDSYAGNEFWYDEIVEGIKNKQLIIGAVSDVARKNFANIYPVEKKIEIFPYGIDDRYKEDGCFAEDETTTFTVVANHASLKGLDILLDALVFIRRRKRADADSCLREKTFNNDYGRRIRDQIDQNANCEYLGELSREKIFDLYSKTDVIIIPSRRDSLPLVATEAMMLKKPCIISDAIGTMGYVRHKYNGFGFSK